MLSLEQFQVQFSSVQYGIYALEKVHRRSTPSLRSFPNVAFQTVPNSVQDDSYALGKAHMRSTPSFRSFPNVVFKTVPMFI